jgi:hypothetical protein
MSTRVETVTNAPTTGDGSCCCGGVCLHCYFCGTCQVPPDRAYYISGTGTINDYLESFPGDATFFNNSYAIGVTGGPAQYEVDLYGLNVFWDFFFNCDDNTDTSGGWTYIFSITEFISSPGAGNVFCPGFTLQLTNVGGVITGSTDGGWEITTTGEECDESGNLIAIPITISGPCGEVTFDFRSSAPSMMAMPPIAPMARSSAPSPCRHEGDSLSGGESNSHGLNPSKRWKLCMVGETKNPKRVPGIVCSCTGCGPSCSQYEAATDE